MTPEEKDRRLFTVCKWIAKELAGTKQVYTGGDRFESIRRDLVSANLHESKVLFDIMVERINANNALIAGGKTKIENMEYKRDWKESVYMSRAKISFTRLEKIFEANPEADTYTIYKEYMNS